MADAGKGLTEESLLNDYTLRVDAYLMMSNLVCTVILTARFRVRTSAITCRFVLGRSSNGIDVPCVLASTFYSSYFIAYLYALFVVIFFMFPFKRLRDAVGELGRGTATHVTEIAILKANNQDIKWQVRIAFHCIIQCPLFPRVFLLCCCYCCWFCFCCRVCF